MLLWTLVIPHDPTPAEERWLAETLAPLAGVPVAWMGRTQLEAAFAEHPHLARAFLPGSSQSRALELLAQHHQEQARLAWRSQGSLRRSACFRTRALWRRPASTGSSLCSRPCRVQDACGASFLVPEQMDPREQALLQFTNLLVRGEHAAWPWPGCLIAMPADSVRALLSTSAVPRMGVTGKGTVPGALVIAGRELTLPGQLQMRAENVVVTNPLHLHRALEHHLSPDAPLQVRLEADGRTTVTFELVESARTDPRLHSTESSRAPHASTSDAGSSRRARRVTPDRY